MGSNWYQEHRQQIIERSRLWKEKNRARYNELTRIRRRKQRKKRAFEMRIYRAKNPDKVKTAARKRYAANPEKYRQRRRESYRRNHSKELEALRRYGKANRKKINDQRRAREKRDPRVAIIERLRRAIIKIVLRRKTVKAATTMTLLGCTPDFLIEHIESQFTNLMGWHNRSDWEIHHIVPLAIFAVTDKEEQFWACNWRNLKPLWREANRALSDTLPNPLPAWLPPHLAARIESRRKL